MRSLSFVVLSLLAACGTANTPVPECPTIAAVDPLKVAGAMGVGASRAAIVNAMGPNYCEVHTATASGNLVEVLYCLHDGPDGQYTVGTVAEACARCDGLLPLGFQFHETSGGVSIGERLGRVADTTP